MPECPNCGAHVTDDFVRVFSDNDGYIPNCLDCGHFGSLHTHADREASADD